MVECRWVDLLYGDSRSGSYGSCMRAVDSVVVVTGAASGIGLAATRHLASVGCTVVGGDIRADAAPHGVDLRPLDVDDDESCRQFVSGVERVHGRIDVLFNNAGFGIAGPAEETSSDEAHAQLETNFFGLTRMCHLVLPGMRARSYSSRLGSVLHNSSSPPSPETSR